jgi:hypothetical protein
MKIENKSKIEMNGSECAPVLIQTQYNTFSNNALLSSHHHAVVAHGIFL